MTSPRWEAGQLTELGESNRRPRRHFRRLHNHAITTGEGGGNRAHKGPTGSLHGRMIPTRTNTCFSANKWAVEQDLHSDQLDEFGTTALIYAVSDRHTDIVELLLHAGANLEIVSTSPSDDASWRDAGVLIIGSGFTTHNLREARFGDVSGSAPGVGPRVRPVGEGNRGRRRYRRNPGLRTHRAGSANRTPPDPPGPSISPRSSCRWGRSRTRRWTR